MFGYKALLTINAEKPHTFAGQMAGSPAYSKFKVHKSLQTEGSSTWPEFCGTNNIKVRTEPKEAKFQKLCFSPSI
jgi:hypothetical protein